MWGFIISDHLMARRVVLNMQDRNKEELGEKAYSNVELNDFNGFFNRKKRKCSRCFYVWTFFERFSFVFGPKFVVW